MKIQHIDIRFKLQNYPRQVRFAREYRGYTKTELVKNIKGLSYAKFNRFDKGFELLPDEMLEKIIYNQIENKHYKI